MYLCNLVVCRLEKEKKKEVVSLDFLLGSLQVLV